MNRIRLPGFFVLFCLLLTAVPSGGQNEPSDSLPDIPDSATLARYQEEWTRVPLYRDTLSNDSILGELFPFQTDMNLVLIRNRETLGQPIVRHRVSHAWRYLVILVLLVVISMVRWISPGTIVSYFKAFLKPKMLSEVLEDQHSEISGFSILMSFLTALLYALPLQYLLWVNGHGMTDYPFGDYILLSLMLFTFIVARFVYSSLGGRILEGSYFVSTSIYSSVFLNFFLASLLIPVFLVMVLNRWVPGPEVLQYSALFAVLVIAAVKVLRALLHAASSFPYPTFYLILYLCAFEIGPWVWVWKLLVINLN